MFDVNWMGIGVYLGAASASLPSLQRLIRQPLHLQRWKSAAGRAVYVETPRGERSNSADLGSMVKADPRRLQRASGGRASTHSLNYDLIQNCTDKWIL